MRKLYLNETEALTKVNNPWNEIDLATYEKHMSLDSVLQLQALNRMMKDQFYSYPVQSIMVLGVAGGNGLEHIDRRKINKVYGVDINQEYLDTCVNRYPELRGILDTIQVDLTQETNELPYADLIVANLIIEYIGYGCFQKAVKKILPKYVSAIIQINENTAFVSNSPYIHAFDCLDEVHHQMKETALVDAMEQIGYGKTVQIDEDLPNGKKFARIDFTFLDYKSTFIPFILETEEDITQE